MTFSRAFSTAAAAHTEDETGEPRGPIITQARKNQHIRYVPQKKMVFDVVTPEGRMVKIFEKDYTGLHKQVRNVKLALGTLIPSIYFSAMLLPYSQAMMAVPALCLPLLQASRYYVGQKFQMQEDIEKLWLLENGN